MVAAEQTAKLTIQSYLWGAQSERHLPHNKEVVASPCSSVASEDSLPQPGVTVTSLEDRLLQAGVADNCNGECWDKPDAKWEGALFGSGSFQMLLQQVELQHLRELSRVREELQGQLQDLSQKVQNCAQGKDGVLQGEDGVRFADDEITKDKEENSSNSVITGIFETSSNREEMPENQSDAAGATLSREQSDEPSHIRARSFILREITMNPRSSVRHRVSVMVNQAREESPHAHVNHTPLTKNIRKVVRSATFDAICALAIILNAILLGVQTDTAARNSNPDSLPILFTYTDRMFSAWFLFELSIRMFADGPCKFFFGQHWTWNLFDFLVVATDIVETSVAVLSGGSSASLQNLTAIRMLRVLRIVRAIRVIRLVRFFKELRMMVFSVLRSGLSLLWSMIMLGIIIFIFSVYLTQNVTFYLYYDAAVSEAKLTETLKDHFGSLIYASYMLFQCISGGISWGEVGRPLLEVHWSNGVVLCFYVFFTVVAVLNIITGIFVDTAINSAQTDRDEVIQEAMHSEKSTLLQMQKFFKEADADKSGTITLEELEEQLQNQRVRAHLATLGIEVNDAKDIFRLLDYDKSGEISIEEFIFGCLKMKGQAKSIDSMTLIHETRRMREQLANFEQHVRSKLQQFQRFQDKMESSWPRQDIFERSSYISERPNYMSERATSSGNMRNSL